MSPLENSTINLLISIIAIVTGAFGITEAITKALKAYKSSCEDDLSVRHDINHLKNHLSQQSLNLGAIESELEGAIKGLDHRLDRLEIMVTEIKVKLQG